MGAISPIGVGVAAFARSLRAGTSGVRQLDWTHPRTNVRAAAQCPDFLPASVVGEVDLARLPRLVPMGLAAAREACAMARLPGVTHADLGPRHRPAEPAHMSGDALAASREVALVLGTGGGGIDFTLDQAACLSTDRRMSLWTITNATHGNLAGELSIRLGLRGPSLCVSTGCASSSDALGLARDLILSDRPGAPRAAVVVGADAHVRWETLAAMELLGVLSKDPQGTRTPKDHASCSRPFDAQRDGFVLGEGAWAVVIERSDAATARGAPVIAEVAGYAATCDAFHRVRPAPEMEECARAITLALQDARVQPGHIDLIHYHGTATPLNDELETKAVKIALGEDVARRVQGHSVKAMIGHPQGASGLASVVATLAGLRAMDRAAAAIAGASAADAFVFPTINLSNPDPACDLDYVPLEPRPGANIRTVLVNCLAFGAKNSALVLKLD
jgi:3-oxoacyl-[acyl-carrier-protein] synthase II